MTLRTKTVFIAGVTVLCLAALLYASAELILVRGYVEVERENVTNNVERALNAIYVQQANLTVILTGYANWDDTYQFVEDQNPQYIERNMIDGTFEGNGLNLMLILNNDLRVIWEKGFDLVNLAEADVPASLRDHLEPGDPLVSFEDEQTIVEGLLVLPEGILMVSSQVILDSNIEGPARGINIWGRFLDDVQLAALSDSTNLNIQLLRTDDSLPADAETAVDELTGDQILVQPLNNDTVAGYTFINDIYGRPSLVLRIEQGREIFAQGQGSISYFLFAVVVGSAIFIIVVLALLEVTVLRRLSTLSATITRVRTTGDLATPVPVEGEDELANLAAGLRAMLEAQAQARVVLQESHATLERRVDERTQELSQANARLHQEIAEREKIQLDLAQARDQALDALRLKTQILANVSHDARTPLTTIMLRTELFQMGKYGQISDEQRKVFEVIFLNARQLLTFVNNLLTEAQFGGEAVRTADLPYSPSALLGEVYRSMLPLAERKGLQLNVPDLEDIPATLYGDEVRLRQIVTNLVDNAIKFTERGSVTMRMRRVGDDLLEIIVADTGKGIPKDVLNRIYEPFWQLDSSKTREANRGVGLGLSIVKQLSTLLGGDVNVKSELGKGTTFVVHLPLYETQGEEHGATVRNGR